MEGECCDGWSDGGVRVGFAAAGLSAVEGGCVRWAVVAWVLLVGVVAVVDAPGVASQTLPPSGDGGGSAESSTTGLGGWWDGSVVLVAAPPRVAEVGSCGSYGGSLALLAGGPLAKVCAGDAPDAAPEPLAGAPRGVGWFEGFDAEGAYVGVELFGDPTVAETAYWALGELDVVFDGGTFTADFSQCTHRAEDGYSSCTTLIPGLSLPPGRFVGVATAGTEPPARTPRSVDARTTPATERAALVALYNATDGANWTRNTGWNTTAPVSHWSGVTTDSDGSVTYLYLSSNNLSGTIPTAIGDLTDLTELSLGSNGLSGGIPVELGDLTNLTSLSLRRSGLSGGIPVELGDLANLTSLDLGRNGLSGGIPGELGDLTNLGYLHLGHNGLSGSIPGELGDLTNLTNLYLAANGLSGSIPAALGGLNNLRGLWLNFNDLSGSIPPELGRLTNLSGLGLSSNDLSGAIPAALGNLTNLTYLNMQLNDLSGAIPPEFSGLTNLQEFDVLGNQMAGPITVLGDLVNLQRLNLSANASIYYELGGGRGFSGPIPAGLGNATGLTFVNLSHNTLSGPIPATFGNLTNLQTLLLDNNAAYVDGEYISGLSGPIPDSLGNLTNLRSLNLSNNRLSGAVPAVLGQLASLQSLQLRSNPFTGCIPAALATVPNIGFDRGLRYCEPLELLAAVLIGGAVELIYDADLDETSVPTVDAFSVNVAGANQTISSVTIAGRVVTVALVSPPSATQDTTVTYVAPATGAKIQTTNGDAAAGFTDEPATIPPDPPTITGVEPTVGGLTVTWTPVGDINGYDVEWRQDTETTWQSTRTGLIGEYTISGLTDDALYWVRVRAVKTTGTPTGQTLYTTAWSQAEPGIAGDWAPRNLEVTPGDRSLTVTWNTVDVADGYEVLYQPQAEAPGSGGTAVRSSDAARSIATDDFAAARPVSAVLSDDRRTARANITGLDNGTTYDVQVRATRTITTPSGVVTPRSAPTPATGTSGVGFVVAEASGPRVVLSGGRVSWTVELKRAPIPPQPDPLLEDLAPFAGRRVGALVSEGPLSENPSNGKVTCVQNGVPVVPSKCATDADGQVTFQYRAATVRTNTEVGVDELIVFSYYDSTRCSIPAKRTDDICKTVGSTKVVRPINLVALGDSYSAGENGKPTDDRSNGFTGCYLSASGTPVTETYSAYYGTGRPVPIDLLPELETDQVERVTGPADAPCRRWTKAYSQRLPSLGIVPGLQFSDENRFRACTGAISLNIYRPATLDLEEVAYLFYKLKSPQRNIETREVENELVPKEVDRPSLGEVLGPSIHYGGEEGDRSQLGSLSDRRVELLKPEDVDMVVLTIGGNDIQFSEILKECLLHLCLELEIPSGQVGSFRPEQLNSRLEEDEWPQVSLYYFEAIFRELTTRLDLVFSKLRASAGDASIFVLGYPDLVPRESDFDSTCDRLDSAWWLADVAVAILGGNLDLDKREREFLRDGSVELNATISDAADRAGFHFVPVADAFSGHETCTNEVAWVNGLEIDFFKKNDRSFHPNQLGHLAYALALRSYIETAIETAIDDAIDDAVADGADRDTALNDALNTALNAAGLPVNPGANRDSRGSGERSARAGGLSGSVGGVPGGERGDTVSGKGDSAESTDGSTAEEEFVVRDVLSHRRLAPVESLCAAAFASPGEVMVLSAAGFAADAAVAVSVRSAAAPWVTVSESSLAAATADDEGRLEVQWTVPVVLGESAPRGYAFEASGAGASGGTLVARSLAPVLAYPGVAPCAVGDAASTMVGQAVRVAVLGNDVAPAGGSLVAASVSVDAVEAASVSVDATDGALTVLPDPGFVGTIVVPYRVADNWGVRVGAAVTVTVEAGCTITGTVGVELIEGTAGDDVICVPDFADPGAFHIIDAKGGDDVIVGGNGSEWVDAGAGDDVVYGSGGADRIAGGSGVDTIYSGPGADVVYGDDLVDVVHDDDGYEFLVVLPAAPALVAPVVADDAAHASAGETLDIAVLDNDHDPNENLVATSLSITTPPTLGAAYVVVPGGGEVVVRYVAGDSGGVDSFTYRVCDTLDSCATATVTVTVGTAGCTIVGTDGDDVLVGTAGADVICGLGGNDIISGRDGDDILVGGAGDDTLYGGDETRIGVDDGDDVLFGGAGDDTLAGGNGADTLWGGEGADILEGNRRDDTLIGGPGDDTLVGGGEDDTLWGGSGDDTLIGHAGDDVLHGGGGGDTLTGGNGEDTLWGGPGNDSLTGGANDDTLWGGGGDDTLRGNTQNDTLWGGPGHDTLHGGGHDDSLVGNSGDDTLYGNAGDDRLWGATGDDTVDGGDDSDYADGGDGVDDCRRAETTARCEL